MYESVDEAGQLDRQQFREALGQFPTGVCVVSATVPDGEDLGMTMSSFNSVSLNPALVLFSIDRRANSLSQWKLATAYCINFLSESQREVSGRFAQPLSSKWTGLNFVRGSNGAPQLHGVTARLQCRPYAQHDAGDHVLFISEVTDYQIFDERNPLIFCKGNYGELKRSDEPAPIWPLAMHY